MPRAKKVWVLVKDYSNLKFELEVLCNNCGTILFDYDTGKLRIYKLYAVANLAEEYFCNKKCYDEYQINEPRLSRLFTLKYEWENK